MNEQSHNEKSNSQDQNCIFQIEILALILEKSRSKVKLIFSSISKEMRFNFQYLWEDKLTHCINKFHSIVDKNWPHLPHKNKEHLLAEEAADIRGQGETYTILAKLISFEKENKKICKKNNLKRHPKKEKESLISDMHYMDFSFLTQNVRPFKWIKESYKYGLLRKEQKKIQKRLSLIFKAEQLVGEPLPLEEIKELRSNI